jgi:hypothetical protein
MVTDFPTFRPEPTGTPEFPCLITRRQAGLLLQKLCTNDVFDGHNVALPLIEQCVDVIRAAREPQLLRALREKATIEAAERAAEERQHGHSTVSRQG